MRFRISTVVALYILCFLTPLRSAHALNQTVPTLEIPQPPREKLDWTDVDRIWRKIKLVIGAPADLPLPPFVLDWEVPAYAKMGFQYPTEKYPNNRLQISIAPRTLDMSDSQMLLFGIGHELAHYIFVLRENKYDLSRKTFKSEVTHHCNPEFITLTRDAVVAEIWSMYHEDYKRNEMFSAISNTCAQHPEQ